MSDTLNLTMGNLLRILLTLWDVAFLAYLIFQQCVPKYVTGSEACNTTLLISRLASDMGIPQHLPKLFYDMGCGIARKSHFSRMCPKVCYR
jgi:hypothetical protein